VVTRAQPESSITFYIVERELALQLLTRAFFIGPCHCSIYFRSMSDLSRSFCRWPES